MRTTAQAEIYDTRDPRPEIGAPHTPKDVYAVEWVHAPAGRGRNLNWCRRPRDGGGRHGEQQRVRLRAFAASCEPERAATPDAFPRPDCSVARPPRLLASGLPMSTGCMLRSGWTARVRSAACAACRRPHAACLAPLSDLTPPALRFARPPPRARPLLAHVCPTSLPVRAPAAPSSTSRTSPPRRGPAIPRSKRRGSACAPPNRPGQVGSDRLGAVWPSGVRLRAARVHRERHQERSRVSMRSAGRQPGGRQLGRQPGGRQLGGRIPYLFLHVVYHV